MSRYDERFIAMSRRAAAATQEAREQMARGLEGRADESRNAEAESFARCDTDGFLSQWAHSMTAQQNRAQARIVRAGGRALFRGLYCGDERIPAVQTTRTFEGRTTYHWLLAPAAAERFGRRYIPRPGYGKTSRIQKQLGLAERWEWAPAFAAVRGSGTGLSGCASATVHVERIIGDDYWGGDAVLATEAETIAHFDVAA